jgi:broad specificity phosphatase PhoE
MSAPVGKTSRKRRDTATNKEILLVRHGHSLANQKGILAGRKEGFPLAAQGTEEIERIAQMISALPIKISHIYFSPILRTAQSAQIISQKLKSDRKETVVNKSSRDLMEMDYGKWSGRKLATLRNMPLWKEISSRPSGVVFPQGEGFIEAQSRLINFIEGSVLSSLKNNETAVLVSHGDPIKMILSHYLGAHLDSFQRISINTGSLSRISFNNNMPVVSAINITSTHTLSTPPQLGGEVKKK